MSEIFEIFARKSWQEMHMHLGSLRAPSAKIALILAKTNFLRRGDPVNSLWVVPRNDVVTSDASDDNLLATELDRSYREVSGYTDNGRLWRMFKEESITLEEIIRFVHSRAVKSKSPKNKGSKL